MIFPGSPARTGSVLPQSRRPEGAEGAAGAPGAEHQTWSSQDQIISISSSRQQRRRQHASESWRLLLRQSSNISQAKLSGE